MSPSLVSEINYEYDSRGRLDHYNIDWPGVDVDVDRSYSSDGTWSNFSIDDGVTVQNGGLQWDTTDGIPQVMTGYVGYVPINVVYGRERLNINLDPLFDVFHWFNLDHLGSSIEAPGIDSPSGYQPYGEANPPDVFNGGANAIGYRAEFTTYGIVHLRNRDYDPHTGTFLTRDPLDGVQGTTTEANAYHYADNDPINKVDPLGLRATDQTFKPSKCRLGDGVVVSAEYFTYDPGTGTCSVNLISAGGIDVASSCLVGLGIGQADSPIIGPADGVGAGVCAAAIALAKATPPIVLVTPNKLPVALVPCPVPQWTVDAYSKLPSSSHCERHHIIQTAAVREIRGFNRSRSPAIMLHRLAHVAGTAAQNAAPLCGTYGDERIVADIVLAVSGVPAPHRRAALAASDRYFKGELGLTDSSPVRRPGSRFKC